MFVVGANRIVQIRSPKNPSTSQAVEKGLKALYIEQQGRLAPRTHDLEYLGQEIHAAATLAADLMILNPAFDLVRYPDPANSDYDLIIVSPQFSGIEPMRRANGLRQIWYRVGGHGPMDLICLTPREFADAAARISLIAAVLPEAIDLLPVEQPATA
ncbi:MAG: HEPN domain-containing protein [Chloroflexota bacterium]